MSGIMSPSQVADAVYSSCSTYKRTAVSGRKRIWRIHRRQPSYCSRHRDSHDKRKIRGGRNIPRKASAIRSTLYIMFPSVITDAERNSVITLSGCCARTVRADSKTNRVNVKSFLIRRNVFGMFFYLTSSMDLMPSRERSMRKHLNSVVLSYWYWRTRFR